ncbi:predicted protein [Histoplasma mississippiense (nom. inval.)]|uniref:predicted protein n=1 Tax=Ajellomyces capsulatus (strain NAm1 / WU24) TaxID=2059318 RepID=UPI000157C3DE|nr:predicted protein [Histoplasma mississippiense (nom. inval.)]EDN07495.1 predicted protein [Histoplasma mississippiense (nom. inval.)]
MATCVGGNLNVKKQTLVEHAGPKPLDVKPVGRQTRWRSKPLDERINPLEVEHAGPKPVGCRTRPRSALTHWTRTRWMNPSTRWTSNPLDPTRWTSNPLDVKPVGRQTRWTSNPLDVKPVGRQTRWTSNPLDVEPVGPNPLDVKPVGGQTRWTSNPLDVKPVPGAH